MAEDMSVYVPAVQSQFRAAFHPTSIYTFIFRIRSRHDPNRH